MLPSIPRQVGRVVAKNGQVHFHVKFGGAKALFDLDKSLISVAYLLGMTLRSAERRQQPWSKTGGLQRTRKPVE